MTDPALHPETSAPAQADLRLLLLNVVQKLVDKPDEVYVDLEKERGTLVLFLEVAPEDLGKVIGRQGSTARALRTLLEAVATKLNVRCELEIVEDDEDEEDDDEGLPREEDDAGAEQ
jgi:predicted RNA-binding protein YlqC (UPF0109 family)